MNTQDPNERSAEAGEYVLGTLNAAERQAFEAAMAQDEGLRREAYAWQDRLMGLTRMLLPVPVSPAPLLPPPPPPPQPPTRAQASASAVAGRRFRKATVMGLPGAGRLRPPIGRACP